MRCSRCSSLLAMTAPIQPARTSVWSRRGRAASRRCCMLAARRRWSLPRASEPLLRMDGWREEG
eukprot:2966998-Rhodomonas_salina.1